MAEPRARLDQPQNARRGVRLPRIDADAFGAWSERIARYFGTARYLAWQTMIVAAWIAVNVFLALNYGKHKAFDPYPFILLNLVFSTQAAYAAPLILLAQNRQDDRDRVQSEQDRQEARESKSDLEYLAREIAAIRMALGEVATRDFLRAELARAEAAREAAREEEREDAAG